MVPPSTPAELLVFERQIDGWLAEHLDSNEAVVAVERGEPGERRWYVRIEGEAKDVYSVWFTLGQRTLRYETYFMPAPRENAEACLANLMRRNAGLFGAAFWIGEEGAIFLGGQLANEALNTTSLDRVLGTLYAAVELCFASAVRLGFPPKLS